MEHLQIEAYSKTPREKGICVDTHYVNATGYTIRILDDNEKPLVVMPPAELREELSYSKARRDVGEVVFAGNGAHVPIIRWVPSEARGLPEPSDGIVYIVSDTMADCAGASGRSTKDLLIPSDGEFSERKQEISFHYFERA